MLNKIERDWVTTSGLRAVCRVVLDSHRCGYVEVPDGHPLYGLPYDERSSALVAVLDRADRNIVPTPEFVFSVHGDLTFAGKAVFLPKNKAGGWWFGFDCGHFGDKTAFSGFMDKESVERSEEFVMQECECLAHQIVELFPVKVSG